MSYISKCKISDSQEVIDGRNKNIIPPPERESLWKAYLSKFKDPIIIVLIVVFALSCCVSIYEVFFMNMGYRLLLEPIGVLVALLLATGVGFIFEVKAEKEFEILNTVKNRRPVKVIRRKNKDARPRLEYIPKHDVVIGDIVRLENGDEIPADGRLIKSNSLRVDESNFTGEMYANKTTNEEDFDQEATYASNYLLRSSTVIEGSGLMIVEHIGMDTEEGKGVARTQEGSDVETPLNKQLGQLGNVISKVSFALAFLIVIGRIIYFWGSGNFVSPDFTLLRFIEYILASVMIAVTLIVVAVPEGLPMSVTVSLAMSMRKMLKENNLVRKLHACETMGAATVICTDKTGTLTQNKMEVMDHACYGGDALNLTYNNIAINSTAELAINEQGEAKTVGNPTEGALLKWVRNNNLDYETIRDDFEILSQEPFSSELKRMETIVKDSSGRIFKFIKGAPDILLDICDQIGDGDVPRQEVIDKLNDFQNKSMRSLAFAVQEIIDGVDTPLRFIGIVGIADPLRHDVKEAIDTCMNHAHVRVIIVTGDMPGVALEIARQVGLVAPDETPKVLSGPEFEALKHDEALALVKDRSFKIISRARPDDKARLVTLLQEAGEVVAVTGDGTNDAPALSKAQVGLSMGDGTSRAKEASDITIIDNSFASINKAIMWGRSLYLNIRRFILFQMTINVCACLVVLLGAFIGVDSPLTVTQMLWVNLIMDTFAAMALSSLPADRNVLNEQPRNPNSHIINRVMLRNIISVGGIFFILMAGLWQLMWHINFSSVSEMLSGENLTKLFTEAFDFSKAKAHIGAYELGVFFSIFVMLQFWNLFNARYFHTGSSLLQDIKNAIFNRDEFRRSFSWSFLGIAGVILFGQILIVSCAYDLFNVSPLSPMDWVLIIAITSPVLIIPEIWRAIKRLKKSH